MRLACLQVFKVYFLLHFTDSTMYLDVNVSFARLSLEYKLLLVHYRKVKLYIQVLRFQDIFKVPILKCAEIVIIAVLGCYNSIALL